MILKKGVIDFKDNYEKSKKWSESEFKQWHEFIYEKKLLNNLKRFVKFDHELINKYLETSEGRHFKKLKDVSFELLNNYKLNEEKLLEMNKQIDDLEFALSKSKLKNSLKIYVRKIPKIFENQTVSQNGKILPEFVEIFKNIYENKIIIKNGFLIGSLTHNGIAEKPADKFPILFEIILPKGTEAGYVGNLRKKPNGQDIILNREYSWKTGKIKIIQLNNQENLKVPVQIFPNI